MSSGRSPVVMPSEALNARLHGKAAEAVKRRHSKQRDHVEFEVDGNLGDDLMTPPDVLLERALNEADRLMREKEDEAAIQEWVRATALSRITHGDAHWQTARCHIELGRAYLEVKDLPTQALTHATKGRGTLLSPGVVGHVTSCDTPPEAVRCLAVAHWVIGRALSTQGQLSGAERSLLRAERASGRYSKIPGVGGADLTLDLDIASAMGKLCMKQSRFDSARTCLEKAVGISQALHGANDLRMVPLQRRLALAELKAGSASDAIATLEGALETAESSEDASADLVGGVLVSLAQAHEASSQPDVAEGFLQRAHGSFCEAFGADHPSSLSCKEELCRVLISRPDAEEKVIRLLKEVIAGKKTVFGERSSEVAHSYKMLGSVHLSRGHVTPAQSCLEVAKELYIATLGEKHHETVHLIKTLEIIAGSNLSLATKQLEKRPRFKTIV